MGSHKGIDLFTVFLNYKIIPLKFEAFNNNLKLGKKDLFLEKTSVIKMLM